MDFVHDQLFDGRKIRALTIIDTFTPLSPAIDVRQSYRGADVVATLERAAAEAGLPKSIRVDNGPEFVSKELDLWAFMRGVTLDFSRPGKPTDNAYVESFSGKFRSECLNANGSSASTSRGENAKVGVETITTFVRIAPSAANRRESFIRGSATPTSRAADGAEISRQAWSSVGGKLNSAQDPGFKWMNVGVTVRQNAFPKGASTYESAAPRSARRAGQSEIAFHRRVPAFFTVVSVPYSFVGAFAASFVCAIAVAGDNARRANSDRAKPIGRRCALQTVCSQKKPQMKKTPANASTYTKTRSLTPSTRTAAQHERHVIAIALS
jgi:Integrase core domain